MLPFPCPQVMSFHLPINFPIVPIDTWPSPLMHFPVDIAECRPVSQGDAHATVREIFINFDPARIAVWHGIIGIGRLNTVM